MATATVASDLAKLLADGENTIIKGWLTALQKTGDGRISTQEVESQARDLLRALTKAVSDGATDVESHSFNDVRAILEGFWAETVEIDDGAAMTWMRQPHYYLGLYPYTYSVGLVAATALAEKSDRDGPAVLAQWLDVLRAGGTLPPLDLMRRVGIDLSSPQPIRDAVAYVGRLIDELEAGFPP